MPTKEENELLTRIGPGTPAGNLLRRYWYPIAVAKELTEENPTIFVRILGEDLVLFKDKKGRVGLVGHRCPHRLASLMYGRIEERGISCAYHGWLFDTEGNCLETPAEPAESKFHLTVKHTAYPVQKFVGLYWTYMGPQPAPIIPKYDVWARKDGRRWLQIKPQLDCNWLQAMENSVDPSHLLILHQTLVAGGKRIADQTRGLTDTVKKDEFYEIPFGIMKKRTYTNGKIDEHPLIFPNILRQANATQIRVPMDDTHTKVFFVRFDPNQDGSTVEEEDENPPVDYMEPFKTPADGQYPFMKFRMNAVPAQDFMVWETQGPIVDRTLERLGTADQGVVMLREMLKREIEKVQKGLDPKGFNRDPAQDKIIDTKMMENLKVVRVQRRPANLVEDGMLL